MRQNVCTWATSAKLPVKFSNFSNILHRVGVRLGQKFKAHGKNLVGIYKYSTESKHQYKNRSVVIKASLHTRWVRFYICCFLTCLFCFSFYLYIDVRMSIYIHKILICIYFWKANQEMSDHWTRTNQFIDLFYLINSRLYTNNVVGAVAVLHVHYM